MAQVPNQIFRLAKTNAGAKYLGLDKIKYSDFIIFGYGAKKITIPNNWYVKTFKLYNNLFENCTDKNTNR